MSAFSSPFSKCLLSTIFKVSAPDQPAPFSAQGCDPVPTQSSREAQPQDEQRTLTELVFLQIDKLFHEYVEFLG